MTELPDNLDTILHLGAGHGEELPAYLASDAQHILLVEPNPILADALRRQAGHDARVQVLELAVTTDDSLNQLNEYNLPEAASLYRPTGLRDLYPGLRITAQHPVNAQTPEQLLAQFPLRGERNLLVIQTPGAELAIIKTLAQTQRLEAISHIWLTCPRDVYYENASRADDALAELERAGFQTEAEHHSHSDWPQWELVCNPMARQAQTLELEKRALTEALKSGKSELEYTKSSLDTIKAELAEARKDFDHQQQAWRTQKQELTTRLESATQYSDEMKNTVASLQEREAELGAALSQANAMVSRLREAEALNQRDKQQQADALEEARAQILELEAAVKTNRDTERHVQSVKADLQQARITQGDLGKELNHTREKLTATEKELQQHKTYLANRKNELAQAEQKNERLEQQIQNLQRQLREQGDSGERFEQLQAQLATMTQSMTQSITQNINTHVDRKLEHNGQQLENTLALHGYLQGGDLPMKQVGTALSAQLALYIAEKIETSQYDLIIEFGSGASTGFLARTVLKRATRHHSEQKQLGGSRVTQNGNELTFVTPDDDDLPKRIISFEHRKEQHTKLEQTLAANGLQQVVELVHAPLVDYRHQGQDYLHYGCESALERIARLYEGRAAKFLVLVNGPPSKTGPSARFPALPKLLNTLGSSTMDVVLSASLREEGHTITEHWSTILEQRGIAFRKDAIDLEKGVTLLAVNHA